MASTSDANLLKDEPITASYSPNSLRKSTVSRRSSWRLNFLLAWFSVSTAVTVLVAVAAASKSRTVFACDDLLKEAEGVFSFPKLPKTPTQPDAVALTGEVGEPKKIRNLQCVYTFVAGPGQRVKLEFEEFHLAGTGDNCELEYVDIYSELERDGEDLLSATLSGRYCGTVSPSIRISLHRYLVLVFHSRAAHISEPLRFRGRYSMISEKEFIPGQPLPGNKGKCGFLIEPGKRRSHSIVSPTYPGTYPKNFHCKYLLKGRPDQRIKLSFRDFDLYFSGEHCPNDFVTVYDGPNTTMPIIKRVCGLQQRMELYSLGSEMLVEFNTSAPAKGDPRGFVIDYEFSSRFVNVAKLLNDEHGLTHMRGSECDVRVESVRETTHYIQSPNYPNMYPANTTCVYVLDGRQSDQDLEKVQLTFEEFAVISDTSEK